MRKEILPLLVSAIAASLVIWLFIDDAGAHGNGGVPLGWGPDYAADYILQCASETGVCFDSDKLMRDSIKVEDEYLVCHSDPIWKMSELDVNLLLSGAWPTNTPFTEEDLGTCYSHICHTGE